SFGWRTRDAQLNSLSSEIKLMPHLARTGPPAPGPGPESKWYPRPKFLLRDRARHCAAKTIRWLRRYGSLDCDALVIDETSLVDCSGRRNLDIALPTTTTYMT